MARKREEEVSGASPDALIVAEAEPSVQPTEPLPVVAEPASGEQPDSETVSQALVKVHNRSAHILTIKSQGSRVFPPGATALVSVEEAAFWKSKGWITVLS